MEESIAPGFFPSEIFLEPIDTVLMSARFDAPDIFSIMDVSNSGATKKRKDVENEI